MSNNIVDSLDKIDVLDHGFVRLVDSMGSDISIARGARTSHDAAWRAGEDTGSDTRLINFLYKNGHNTPFECVTLTFEVKAPIFVVRQWHRHRTQSYNEVSARYRELPEEFYVPNLDQITTQSKGHKQMRSYLSNPRAKKIQDIIHQTSRDAFYLYRAMLDMECPRELARSVLPVGTYTHMFTTMNLHNLFKFLSERLHPHAQYEIRVYAKALLELVGAVAPVAIDAFINSLGDEYEL